MFPGYGHASEPAAFQELLEGNSSATLPAKARAARLWSERAVVWKRRKVIRQRVAPMVRRRALRI